MHLAGSGQGLEDPGTCANESIPVSNIVPGRECGIQLLKSIERLRVMTPKFFFSLNHLIRVSFVNTDIPDAPCNFFVRGHHMAGLLKRSAPSSINNTMEFMNMIRPIGRISLFDLLLTLKRRIELTPMERSLRPQR